MAFLLALALASSAHADGYMRSLEELGLVQPTATPVQDPCPDGMIGLRGFCIDKFEAPNIEGAQPFAARKASEAVAWCADQGKRLCTEAEWTRACEGASNRRYPYGDKHQKGRCHDNGKWSPPDWIVLQSYPAKRGVQEAERLYGALPSGARAACESEEGVVDLVGNVAEWVQRSWGQGNPQVMKGGFWAGGWGLGRQAPPSCGSRNGAHPDRFRTYEAGFRCCLSR